MMMGVVRNDVEKRRRARLRVELGRSWYVKRQGVSPSFLCYLPEVSEHLLETMQ